MRLNFWIAYRLLFSRQILFGGSAPLSFLGLVLGVAALVASMAVMSGYVETLKLAMTDVTSDLQVVRRGKLVEDWATFSKKIKEQEPRIESMMRFGYAEAVMARKGQVSGVLFQGVEEAELAKVLNITKRVKHGQLQLGPDQIAIGIGLSKKYNVVVGEKIYLVVPLATPFDSSGFKRQSKEFVVTAVIDFGKNDWNERLVIGNLKSLQQLTEIGDRYTGAFIKLKDRETANEAAINLEAKLGTGFSVMTWYDVNRNIFEAVVIERAVIFFVVLLIVIVAAFNISSTLYVFIRQKYSDIAILKTLGLSQKKIRLIFLSQGLIVGTLGTIIGVIIGYDLCFAFMYLQDHYALISGSVYKIDKIYTDIRFIDLFAICAATQLICLVATYFPAYKGSQLEVVEGLKNG
ncbi:ABC transporter permease [bacterium]|nr:ABC transporter permease [bacterium]